MMKLKKGLIINEKATNKTDQSVRKVHVLPMPVVIQGWPS